MRIRTALIVLVVLSACRSEPPAAASLTRTVEVIEGRERREWSDDALGALASEVGVPDRRAFDVCLASDAPHPRIESGIRNGTELDAFGTPTIIANGVLLGKIPTRQDLLVLLQSSEPGSGG